MFPEVAAMNVQMLVSQAMKASGKESIRAFAEEIGVSHTAVGKWMDGSQVPTFEQAAELAILAGLDPVTTAAQVRMHSKDGAKHRLLLRRLAQVAALGGFALIAPTLMGEQDALLAAFSLALPMHYAKLRRSGHRSRWAQSRR